MSMENPEIIVYPKIFDNEENNREISILFKQNKNTILWFTDNPHIITDKDPSPFPDFIDKIRLQIEKITDMSFNTCLLYTIKTINSNVIKTMSTEPPPMVSFGSEHKLWLKSKKNDLTKEIDIPSGSLLVKKESVKKYWNINISNNTNIFLSFFYVYPPEHDCDKKSRKKLPYDLKSIYLSTKMRMGFIKKIKNGLYDIHSIQEGGHFFLKDGKNTLNKNVKLDKLIGIGDWGNVYSACLRVDKSCHRKFAVKMSRIGEDDLKDPYTETSSSWYEIWMLKDIIKPLISVNICPNLPLFIDTFLCNKCDFVFRKGDNTHPCVINVMELASGDMRDYLKSGDISDKELYSALFQVMAGLHAIQMSGQILNNDIKSKNILYYDVKSGGYWHYKIGTDNFYVPNYGKMFVLNDFGVSNLYNPNFQLYPNKHKKVFNLGSRYAINMDEIFSPIQAGVEYTRNDLRKTKEIKWIDNEETSHGATYKIDRKTGQVILSKTLLTPLQKSFLFRNGVTTNPKTWEFFERPDIIPPFEFYNDVQDVLRTFVGGKRTTQKGYHTLYPNVSKNVQETISQYLGKAENSKNREFSINTYHVLAGSFIKKFFTDSCNYKKRPKGKKISYYDMNKCLKT